MIGLPHRLSACLSNLLIDRGGRHRQNVLAAFRDKQRQHLTSPEDIAAHQSSLLIHLLEHAGRTTPFWKEHLAALSLESSDILTQLADLPIMERGDIQKDSTQFVSSEAPSYRNDATGGSTGTPLKFPIDPSTQIARESSLYWADSLAGWNYGERIAMLWGSDRDVSSSIQQFKGRLRNGIENRRWYNTFHVEPGMMEMFRRQMSRFNPHILVGYAGSLDVFSRHLESENQQPDFPQKSIISSAEVLTPEMRERIERVFQKKVYNRYGNREFGAIAVEDQYGQLQINHWDMIVEIDSPDPFTQPGPILITYLRNHAMPFIRYNTGDLGRFEKNKQGALCLKEISGRQSDTLTTASGKQIHGEFFTHLMYGCPEVVQFQFVQETRNSYSLRLVADQSSTKKYEPTWQKEISEAVGEDAVLSIEYVKEIPLTASGKRKFTLSLVDEGRAS